jgi:Rod binding domain-containing protein
MPLLTAPLPARQSALSLQPYRAVSGPFGLKLRPQPTDNQDGAQQAKLTAACGSFEGFLVGEMLKIMRESVGAGQGVLPVSRAETIFVRQQCEALGEVLAQRQPLGIARMLQQSVQRSTDQTRRQTP